MSPAQHQGAGRIKSAQTAQIKTGARQLRRRALESICGPAKTSRCPIADHDDGRHARRPLDPVISRLRHASLSIASCGMVKS
jgi:hypothetical protein